MSVRKSVASLDIHVKRTSITSLFWGAGKRGTIIVNTHVVKNRCVLKRPIPVNVQASIATVLYERVCDWLGAIYVRGCLKQCMWIRLGMS